MFNLIKKKISINISRLLSIGLILYVCSYKVNVNRYIIVSLFTPFVYWTLKNYGSTVSSDCFLSSSFWISLIISIPLTLSIQSRLLQLGTDLFPTCCLNQNICCGLDSSKEYKCTFIFDRCNAITFKELVLFQPLETNQLLEKNRKYTKSKKYQKVAKNQLFDSSTHNIKSSNIIEYDKRRKNLMSKNLNINLDTNCPLGLSDCAITTTPIRDDSRLCKFIWPLQWIVTIGLVEEGVKLFIALVVTTVIETYRYKKNSQYRSRNSKASKWSIREILYPENQFCTRSIVLSASGSGLGFSCAEILWHEYCFASIFPNESLKEILIRSLTAFSAAYIHLSLASLSAIPWSINTQLNLFYCLFFFILSATIHGLYDTIVSIESPGFYGYIFQRFLIGLCIIPPLLLVQLHFFGRLG